MEEPSLPWSKVSLEEGFLLKCSHHVHKRVYLPKVENTVISSKRDRDKFQVQFKYGKAGSHMLLAGGQGEQDVSCGHWVPGQFYWQMFEVTGSGKRTSLPLPEPKEDLEHSAYLEHQAMRQAFKLSTESHSLTLWLVLPLTVGLVLDPPDSTLL